MWRSSIGKLKKKSPSFPVLQDVKLGVYLLLSHWLLEAALLSANQTTSPSPLPTDLINYTKLLHLSLSFS